MVAAISGEKCSAETVREAMVAATETYGNGGGRERERERESRFWMNKVE
jgi:hypothetical protein